MESRKRKWNRSESNIIQVKRFKTEEIRVEYEEDASESDDLERDFSNGLLEKYYRIQFNEYLSEEDFELLFKKMKEELPVSFRVVSTHPKTEFLCELLSSKDWFTKLLSISKPSHHLVDIKVPLSDLKADVPIKQWEFYPNNHLYELPYSKRELKGTNEELSSIHKFLQQCNSAGLITRQEVVSTIPPLLLDVKPGMKVLDMCAAPGSKASQLLEYCLKDCLKYKLTSEAAQNGVVVTNDVDSERSYMLTHQLQRFDTPGLLVLNTNAQNFTNLYYTSNHMGTNGYDTRYRFDRVLCDVPCSSDGAIRKIPAKWKYWETRVAFELHSQQIRLLMKALQLATPGGLVCYSTCSLNPIENEAVVQSVMKLYCPMIELVGVQDVLPKFKFRPGLTKWQVITESTQNQFITYKEVPQELSKIIKDTMFCSDSNSKFNLEKCARVFPHDQDTGGFFVALFKKVGELNSSTSVHNEEVKILKPIIRNYKPVTIGQYSRINDTEAKLLKEFYGLEGFPIHLLFVRGVKLLLVTEGVNEFLEVIANSSMQNQVINIGVPCFKKVKRSFNIIQEGAHYLLPYMTKRTILCSIEMIRDFVDRTRMNIGEIKDETVRNEIERLTFGSFLLFAEGKCKEVIVVNKSGRQITLSAKQEDIIKLRIRLLTL